MTNETKWTPGPHRFEQDDKAPFYLNITDDSGFALISGHPDCSSSYDKTFEDHLQLKGWFSDGHEDAIAANNRQRANFQLWAAAPEMYKALDALIAANKKARSFQNVKAQAEAALNQKAAEKVALAVLAKARGEA